jgi:hypothetical protein
VLQRSACLVLGNIGTHEDLAVLEAMTEHEHTIVREHAVWAITRLSAPHAEHACASPVDHTNRPSRGPRVGVSPAGRSGFPAGTTDRSAHHSAM